MAGKRSLVVACALFIVQPVLAGGSVTPESAAGALGNILSLQPRLAWQQGQFDYFAARYADIVHSRVVALGGVGSLGATPVEFQCPGGGVLQLSAVSVPQRIVGARFIDCDTPQEDLHYTANGTLRLGYASFDGDAPRFSLVQFGTPAGDFSESVQWDPSRDPQLPPNRYSLGFTLAGALPRWDSNAIAQNGSFQYLVNGRIGTEEYSIYAGDGSGSVVRFDSILAARQVSTAGFVRLTDVDNPQDVSVRTYRSGSFDYQGPGNIASQAFAINYRFEGFRVGLFDNWQAGTQGRSYDGEIEVSDSAAACANGDFKIETEQRLEQPQFDGNFGFYAGKVRVQGKASIQFSAEYPGAVVDVGHTTVALADGAELVAFGGCSY